ncbi:MAG: carboxypeptidase-like regulatory domain-containing protein [Bacteroidota bacterium]|nr:carboxypeptidase-like regulatory domain-containing protein [Bacteroidota bacterium]
MKVVEQKKIESVRYLFGSPSTVKSRYNQIKRTFPEGDEYKIFAEAVFVEDTNSIIWSTEFSGSIVNYKKLSPTDQIIANKLLTKSIQNILASAKTFETSELTDFIYNCIEIPSMENVFIIRGDGDDKVLITEWGFVSDTAGMEKGLLAKIINVKRVPMIISIVYKDTKEPASNIKFSFDYEEHTEEKYSDIDGKIELQDVKVDEKVKAYQKDEAQIINEQEFICYEDGQYEIEVERTIDMPFEVINEKNEPLASITFTFDYNGIKKNLTSDAEGNITLAEVKAGTEVAVYQTVNEEKANIHNFICENEKEYVLKVVSPEEPVYNMRFKVVDPNGDIVPNAKVKVKYNKKSTELFTDDEGYAVLEDIEPNTQVKVVAIGKKKKEQKEKNKKNDK